MPAGDLTFQGDLLLRILVAAVLGAAHRVFGCERFIVNPYQFGAGNAEAIRSGAFWFYYRLGFRPVDGAIAARAAREFARLSGRRGARHSRRVGVGR